MSSSLNSTIKELGDGKVIQMASGDYIFKLDSYPENPIIRPQDIGLTWYEKDQLKIGAVFNAGAELFENKVVLMPRCHRNYQKGRFFDEKLGIERSYLENYISEIWPLVSEDGVHFTRFQNALIRADGTDHQDFAYGIEDIRIIKYGHRYLLVGCGKIKAPFKGGNADRIAIYTTNDFADFHYQGMVESFDSRNAVPFPERTNGDLFILLRFHPNIHIGLLEAGINQLLNPAKHRECWKKLYEQRSQNLLLKSGLYPHEKEKIGPGSQLIKTDKGWLLIYHAVGEIDINICKAYGLSKKIERGYSICAAILDLEDPQRVICRSRNPIYIPSAPYELYGNKEYPIDVPAVVFPVGTMIRQNKMLLYAGAGDKYTILLSCKLDSILNYLLEYCRL